MENPDKKITRDMYVSICFTQIYISYFEFMKGIQKLVLFDDYLDYLEDAIRKCKEKE